MFEEHKKYEILIDGIKTGRFFYGREYNLYISRIRFILAELEIGNTIL